MIGMTIRDLPVNKVFITPAAEIATEAYVGVIVDRESKRAVFMVSPAGGIDIEEVARVRPEKIARVWVDPLLGLRTYQARNLAAGMELPRAHWGQFTDIARALYRVYKQTDASLAEINPLVILGGGSMLALDGKIVLDDNALFRHPELAELRDLDEEAASEREARKYGLSYVKLDGDVGCMVNGAGLAMATMDVIQHLGGRPANFLDVGGGAPAEKVAAALEIILSDRNVRVVLLNIFGGITRCDEVARGILMAMEEVKPQVPMVARLVGTNEEEGRRLLAEAKMITATSLLEGAERAVAAAKGEAIEHPG